MTHSEPHPTHAQLSRDRISFPFCDALHQVPNKSMADWIVPYIAKFTNPRKIKICSQLKELMSGQGQSFQFYKT